MTEEGKIRTINEGYAISILMLGKIVIIDEYLVMDYTFNILKTLFSINEEDEIIYMYQHLDNEQLSFMVISINFGAMKEDST